PLPLAWGKDPNFVTLLREGLTSAIRLAERLSDTSSDEPTDARFVLLIDEPGLWGNEKFMDSVVRVLRKVPTTLAGITVIYHDPSLQPGQTAEVDKQRGQGIPAWP